MKFGFIGNLYGTPRGHSYVVKQMVETLIEAGHEVHMYRIGNNEILPEFPFPKTLETEHGMIIPENSFRKWLRVIRPDWCIFNEYQQWWEEDHDKVAICKELGIKTMGYNVWERLDWDKLDHYKKYTKLMAPTRFQTKLMRKHGLYQTCHIPWGINLKLIDEIPMERKKGDKVRFFHCAGSGGVGDRKNTDVVIQAYKMIKDENTDLIITHLQAKVFSWKEIISFTKYSDVLLNPSRWDTIGLNCQPKKSIVYTKNGIKHIEDIKIGDFVLTHKNKYEKVINTLKGHNYLHNIECGYANTLKLTADHPILTVQANKKQYKEKKIKFKPKWIKAKNIKPYDFISIPKPKYVENKKSIDISEYINMEKPAKIKIDKKLCKLLGFFVAKGWTENGSAFGFAFHTKEKDYHNFVLKVMKNKFNLDGKLIIDGNKTNVVFFSSVVSEFFEKLCNKYAINKDVPRFLLHLNTSLQKEFLKGYFYGDGCISKKTVTASSIFKKLIYNIKYLLLRCNILSKITKYKSRNKIWGNCKNYYCIKLAYSKKMCNLFKLKYSLPRYEFYFEDDNYFYVKVKTNTITNKKVPVYNITVQNDHSYCGEIVLHNSIEANACGVPVIVANTEPMNELVRDRLNGLVVDGEKGTHPNVTCPTYNVYVDELAKKMSFIKDKLIRDTLKTNARKFAEENFDWNKNKVHFLKMFEV